MVMLVNAEQEENADLPMVCNCEPSANVTVCKLLQDRNAYSPMLVTFAGMVMLVNAEQEENA